MCQCDHPHGSNGDRDRSATSRIRLQTKTLLATTRMQSLSTRHSIHEWLANALRTRTACIPHRSNLENILQQFPHMCATIEKIEMHIRPPWWTPTAKIRIEATKEAAKKQHDEIQAHLDTTTMTIYTDDSGIEIKNRGSSIQHNDK
jgi:hypothetical protein